jgi:hypothetical protein
VMMRYTPSGSRIRRCVFSPRAGLTNLADLGSKSPGRASLGPRLRMCRKQ